MSAETDTPHGDEMPEGKEPPPRGVRVMAIVRWVLLAAFMGIAVFAWISYAKDTRSKQQAASRGPQAPRYHCPMHPQVVSDEPGECPICHMTLEPFSETAETGDAGATGSERAPSGTAPVRLAVDRIQSIGVRTSVVEEKQSRSALRVTAAVAPAEQGLAEVHVRSPGFVESIAVNQSGARVGKGQLLFSVYSPEIYQAESELLAASRWEQVAPDAGATHHSMADAAKKKLELLGMTPDDIEDIIDRKVAVRATRIYAPAGGFVTKKNVVLGSYVTPEATLYEIQDLSSVYVVADVFQSDIGALAVGTEGRFTPTRNADAATTAKVDLIYPLLNQEARTVRVRMQVKNGKQALRPGEFGTVEFGAVPKKMLVVPRDAVVDTGEATYVFLVGEGGLFSPRTVVLGEGIDQDVAIQSGLAAGDRVVSGATFLIDSESRLQASKKAISR